MLKEFKKVTLINSNANMKNIMSGEHSQAYGPGMDEGDAAQQNQLQHLVFGRFTSQRDAIKDIEAAIERIDAGVYGICEECGTEITEGRLKIIPFAKCCRDCQEEKERLRASQ